MEIGNTNGSNRINTTIRIVYLQGILESLIDFSKRRLIGYFHHGFRYSHSENSSNNLYNRQCREIRDVCAFEMDLPIIRIKTYFSRNI